MRAHSSSSSRLRWLFDHLLIRRGWSLVSAVQTRQQFSKLEKVEVGVVAKRVDEPTPGRQKARHSKQKDGQDDRRTAYHAAYAQLGLRSGGNYALPH